MTVSVGQTLSISPLMSRIPNGAGWQPVPGLESSLTRGPTRAACLSPATTERAAGRRGMREFSILTSSIATITGRPGSSVQRGPAHG